MGGAGMSSYPDFGNDWPKRWVYLEPRGRSLHRVASTIMPPGDQEADGLIPIGIQGSTACGKIGRLSMPGVLSRMHAPRCARCCRLVGIPTGHGEPFNQAPFTEEQRNG